MYFITNSTFASEITDEMSDTRSTWHSSKFSSTVLSNRVEKNKIQLILYPSYKCCRVDIVILFLQNDISSEQLTPPSLYQTYKENFLLLKEWCSFFVSLIVHVGCLKDIIKKKIHTNTLEHQVFFNFVQYVSFIGLKCLKNVLYWCELSQIKLLIKNDFDVHKWCQTIWYRKLFYHISALISS